MCGCTWNFTCSRCAGTPFDPHYLDDEPELLTEPDFAELVDERSWHAPIIMLGEDE